MNHPTQWLASRCAGLVFFLGAALALTAHSANAGLLDGLMGEKVRGNGNVRQEVRQPVAFSGISLSLPAKLEIRQGTSESVTLVTDDNLLPLVETVVQGSTLEIRTAKRNMTLEPSTLKLVVQVRQIDRISVAGAGAVSADALRAGPLNLDIGGAGSIKLRKLVSDALHISIGGSGDVLADGSANKLAVSIAGSGQVRAAGLKTRQASVDIAGSGEAALWVQDSLKTSIAGAGEVSYWGDPAVSSSVMGSGEVKRLGAAPR